MKELEYPFDSSYVIKNKIRLRKQLLCSKEKRIKVNIAILGGSTTHDVCKCLELFLLNQGIEPSFYESEYNKYWEDAMFTNETLLAFRPDIIYVHTSTRNLTTIPNVMDTEEKINEKLQTQFNHFTEMWEKLHATYSCPLIQNNFERPFIRKLGNMDVSDYRGLSNYVSRLNEMFYKSSQEKSWLHINDIEFVSAVYGLDKWVDLSTWYMYKYIMAINAIPDFSYNLSKIIKSIYGRNKKVLAVDLDNTMWGGVLSEDGVQGIDIGEDSAAGEMYSEIQQYVKELKDVGILLAINSKNDMQLVEDAFSQSDMKIRLSDFSIVKANWENKDDNIISISKVLNLGVDSIVFLDDNPTERTIVKEQIPAVAVPEVDVPENYIKILDHSGYYETISLSEEDISRTQMYAETTQREQAKEKYASYEEFLASLNMEAIIKNFDDSSVQRIAQLTNKSNQFNLTTKRYTEEEISRFKEDSNYICLYGRLRDKFGDNGIVSILIAKKEEYAAHIELLLMSCRVLKRGMEDAMMDKLVELAKSNGCKKVYGYFFPTNKNAMVENLYGTFGFQLIKDEDGSKQYSISIECYEQHNKNIKVV